MDLRGRDRPSTNWILIWWTVTGFLAATAASHAQEFGIESAGARFGFSSKKRSHNVNQAEGFANFNLPWRWDLGKDWFLKPRLDLTAGWIGGGGDDAGIFSLGPSFILGHERFPLSIDLGFSPAFITRHEFGALDVGTLFQITSHAGLDWDFSKHWRFGYRFQHMSNGGLTSASTNPGVNMNLFGLSYLF
jgi:hypothetical protein